MQCLHSDWNIQAVLEHGVRRLLDDLSVDLPAEVVPAGPAERRPVAEPVVERRRRAGRPQARRPGVHSEGERAARCVGGKHRHNSRHASRRMRLAPPLFVEQRGAKEDNDRADTYLEVRRI